MSAYLSNYKLLKVFLPDSGAYFVIKKRGLRRPSADCMIFVARRGKTLNYNDPMQKSAMGKGWLLSSNLRRKGKHIFRQSQGKTRQKYSFSSFPQMGRWLRAKRGAIHTLHRYFYLGYLQIATLDFTRSTLNDLWLTTWDPTD